MTIQDPGAGHDAEASTAEADHVSDWDYATHPGDCHTRREAARSWTACCRECAGTGVFPVPWIDTPAEGREDLGACSCVACKATGRTGVAV